MASLMQDYNGGYGGQGGYGREIASMLGGRGGIGSRLRGMYGEAPPPSDPMAGPPAGAGWGVQGSMSDYQPVGVNGPLERGGYGGGAPMVDERMMAQARGDVFDQDFRDRGEPPQHGGMDGYQMARESAMRLGPQRRGELDNAMQQGFADPNHPAVQAKMRMMGDMGYGRGNAYGMPNRMGGRESYGPPPMRGMGSGMGMSRGRGDYTPQQMPSGDMRGGMMGSAPMTAPKPALAASATQMGGGTPDYVRQGQENYRRNQQSRMASADGGTGLS